MNIVRHRPRPILNTNVILLPHLFLITEYLFSHYNLDFIFTFINILLLSLLKFHFVAESRDKKPSDICSLY
jgi:hypothetical protein